MTKRRIFVGDVQGCREELETLLERVRFDPAADELHPTGDFVNRGPDSAGVLRVCRALGTGVVGGVLGNHDVHALRVAAGMRRCGERDTLDALLAADDRGELLAWLAARPFVRAWNDVLLVHAAVHPAWIAPERVLASEVPLVETDALAFAVTARYCAPDGSRPARDWPEPGAPFRPWFEYWKGPRTVVFGHWARLGLVREERVLGLDTGCVWGGELTAWIAEENRIVQVRARRAWAEHDRS